MTTANQDPLGLNGTTVDKYDILSLAGEGGFSVVYRAEHRIWKQPVAIKFFTLLEEAKPELRERLLEDFLREGKLLSELSSRTAAILQARDIGRLERGGDRWIPYMVLEWLEGQSLEALLAELQANPAAAPTLPEAMRLLASAVEALEIAHAQGIAHRDLKPANLMVLGDWRAPRPMVKVLDFGIAKVMGEHEALQEQLQLTGAQMSAFTPAYGAPEQFTRTFGATGPWTDVYAMALILLQLMLGGEPPLRGATLYDVGHASCDPEHRPTPRSFGLEVPDEVERVFERALALRPEDRFPTMGQFWGELRSLVVEPTERTNTVLWTGAPGRSSPSGAGLSTSRPPVSQRSLVTPDGPTVAAMLTSVPAPLKRARWPRVAAGAALAAAAVVAVAALSYRGADSTAVAGAGGPGADIPAGQPPLEPVPPSGSAPSGGSGAAEEAVRTATGGGGPASTVAAVGIYGEASGGPTPEHAPSGQAAGALPRPTGGTNAGRANAPAAGAAAAPTARGAATATRSSVDPWDPNSFGGRR